LFVGCQKFIAPTIYFVRLTKRGDLGAVSITPFRALGEKAGGKA
jgi:hypothetical protein